MSTEEVLEKAKELKELKECPKCGFSLKKRGSRAFCERCGFKTKRWRLIK